MKNKNRSQAIVMFMFGVNDDDKNTIMFKRLFNHNIKVILIAVGKLI